MRVFKKISLLVVLILVFSLVSNTVFSAIDCSTCEGMCADNCLATGCSNSCGASCYNCEDCCFFMSCLDCRCVKNSCGATCDGPEDCPNYCAGEIRHYDRTCNYDCTSCSCTSGSTTDCTTRCYDTCHEKHCADGNCNNVGEVCDLYKCQTGIGCGSVCEKDCGANCESASDCVTQCASTCARRNSCDSSCNCAGSTDCDSYTCSAGTGCTTTCSQACGAACDADGDCPSDACTGTCGTGTDSCMWGDNYCETSGGSPSCTCKSNNYDPDTLQARCTGCGQNWAVGGSGDCTGEQCLTNCCGDDSGEKHNSRVCSSGCSSSSTDDTCCDNGNDCVYSGTCYSQANYCSPWDSNSVGSCSAGSWSLVENCLTKASVDSGDSGNDPTDYGSCIDYNGCASASCTSTTYNDVCTSSTQLTEYYAGGTNPNIYITCSPNSGGPGTTVTVPIWINGNSNQIETFGLDLDKSSPVKGGEIVPPQNL